MAPRPARFVATRPRPDSSHGRAAVESARVPAQSESSHSVFATLLWLLAAAAVLPGAVDLPFLRGEVATASQLDSLIGRGTAAGLALVAMFAIMTRIAGSRLEPVFGVLAWAWGMILLISWILGDSPVDLIRPIVLVLVAIALGLCRIPLPKLLWHARSILRAFLVLCLISIFVAPEYAWFPSSGREWFGIPQFAGVAPHPNALGPIAALALLLELVPGGRRRLRWMFAICAVAILLLTQSRAGWAAGLLAVFAFLLIPAGRIEARRALVIVQGALVVALAAFLVISDPGSEDITNGRLGLWAAVLERAEQSWLFGYGSTAFSAASRSANQFALWAGQAHNQILESLFTGGLLALAPLAVLVVLCAARALRAGPQRPVTLAAFAILFFDLWIESPLRPTLASSVLMSVIVLAIISASVEQQSEIVVTK